MKTIIDSVNNKSLGYQLAFSIVTSFIGLIVLIGACAVVLYGKVADDILDETKMTISKRATLAISPFMIEGDMISTASVLKAEVENKSVSAIRLTVVGAPNETLNVARGKDGLAYVLEGPLSADLEKHPQKLKKMVFIKKNDMHIATLEIFLTTEYIDEIMLRVGLIFSINFALLLFFILAIMTFLIKYIFLNRIKTLKHALDEVIESDKVIPPKLQIDEDNELGIIRQKINQIQDKFRMLITNSLKSENAAKVALEDLRVAQRHLIQSEKMAALGGVVAGVAHELNTPLGNSLVAITTLQAAHKEFLARMEMSAITKSNLKEFMRTLTEGLSIACSSATRAATLVEKFKQVAVDQTHERIRQFKIEDIVAEALVVLQSMTKKTKQQIILDVPSDLSAINYPGSLYQILSNLIANALIHGVYGRPDGKIFIEAKSLAHGMLEIKISDNGVGISKENMAKVFDPFFTTTFGRGGSGLGLHIAFNETLKLKGKLSVESKEGEGTIFTLLMPTFLDQETQPMPLGAS